jgi:hypothetical protein
MPLTRITSQLISIPSNYPLTGSLNGTASYAITLKSTNWTGSSFVTNDTTQSIAAFNISGSSMLVTPTSDNVYLVVQNGIMKWIPIATVAVSFLNSTFSETEYIYQPSLTILPSVSFLNSFFSENEYIYKTPLTLLASVSFITSFTSGSI